MGGNAFMKPKFLIGLYIVIGFATMVFKRIVSELDGKMEHILAVILWPLVLPVAISEALDKLIERIDE
jgi:hypothetical protein